MIRLEIGKANKCSGEWSLYATFSYDPAIVAQIKAQKSRYFDTVGKSWELPLNALKTLLTALEGYSIELCGDTTPLKASEGVKMPPDFVYKTKPYAHQEEGLLYGLNHSKWLLGDEQGLGKTKQVIDIAVAKRLEKGYKHCLIVCGVNGLKWNWANEIKMHSDEEGFILGQSTRKGKIIIGSNKDKYHDIVNLENRSEYFIITNIETLRDKDIAESLEDACDKGIIGMIAFDECHKAKNPTSQQGKGILKIHADTMIAMTGTPMMNQPMDLYIILKWLGFEKHSFYAFKNHYCEMGGFGGYEVIGYKNLDELQENLNSLMLRRLKDEVLDLPEKTYINEYVEMTSKQAILYKEVSTDIQMNIDKVKASSNPLAELIRLRQATGYTGILSSTIKESAKLDRMEELVEEAISNGKQVVIFSNWTQMTDAIEDRFNSKGFFKYDTITGETKDEHRQFKVNSFQDGETKVLIGTIGAMGTGLTLTAGSVEIFMDEPWNRALYDQAVDRCHRVGQNKNITIYNLMCKNTIDEKIHEIVVNKGEMSDLLVDGKMSNREMVDFLLS